MDPWRVKTWIRGLSICFSFPEAVECDKYQGSTINYVIRSETCRFMNLNVWNAMNFLKSW